MMMSLALPLRRDLRVDLYPRVTIAGFVRIGVEGEVRNAKFEMRIATHLYRTSSQAPGAS